MGSLTSRPKVPETILPQTVFFEQPVAESITNPVPVVDVPTSTNTEDVQDSPTPSNTDAEIRISSLLRRNRGITGTIQTGFRGLLSESGVVPQRKTLLGE